MSELAAYALLTVLGYLCFGAGVTLTVVLLLKQTRRRKCEALRKRDNDVEAA